ncbi:MAG: MBL fold metallo-hydrolase [Candidatus Bathyarchaeota archaeon]|nr:MBL fold metallo-hydrolase [Candidatus Bathyarchaeota archaeon]
MVGLRFLGGVGEVGGNKIMLEDGDTRVWLDFGKSFTSGADYYTGYLAPRGIAGLKDYFEFDLLPKIEGLYSEEMLAETEIKYGEPRFDGIIISHAHGDHVGHLGFVDPSIPVYTGAGTKLFMEASDETSQNRLGEHAYHAFRTGARIKIGSLEVCPIHVDHSIPGAYGFIIYTSEGTLVYTGDMRAHGPKSDMTEEFIEAAAHAKPRAMITEGTRVTPEDHRQNLTEQQVATGIAGVCNDPHHKKRLIIYTHGPRDMDRLRNFYAAATACGRKIVIAPKTAHLLSKLIHDEHLDLPDPIKDESIAVYYRRKKSGSYDESDYFRWERPYLDKMVTPAELKREPGGYMVNIDFTGLTELIDVRPERGTPFIYSMSEHFSEDEVEGTVLKNWISHFGLEHVQLHASGHISRGELAEAIERIRPKKVFPVHTEHPEMFKRMHDAAVPPVKGKGYAF